MADTIGIWRLYTSYLNRARQRRADRRTLAAVSDLPQHLLKDIGWPGGYDSGRERRGR